MNNQKQSKAQIQNEMEALRQSVQNKNLILDNAYDLISINKLHDLTYEYVNFTTLKVLGYSEEELLGKSALDFIHPDDAVNAAATIKENLENKKGSTQFRYRKKDGAYIWLEITAKLMPDGDKHLSTVVVISRDITDRKNLEADLQKSYDDLETKVQARTAQLKKLNEELHREIVVRKDAEELLRKESQFNSAILNTSDALIKVSTAEGKIIAFNTACEQASGYSSNEVQNKYPWDFFVHGEDVATVQARYKALRMGEQQNTGENYWLTKDGQKRLIKWTNNALLDQNGELEYIVSTGIDITGQHEAQAALRKSEVYYRTIFENTGTAKLIVDKNQNISKVNSVFEQLFGYSEDKLEGKPLTSFVTAESADLIMEKHLLRQRNSGSNHNRCEITAYSKAGDRRNLICNISIIPESPNYVVSLLDITEQRRAEEALKQQVVFQELLLKISKSFTNIVIDDIDDKLNDTLQYMGEFDDDDRSYIFLFSDDESKMNNTHEWCAAGIQTEINKIRNITVDNLPWFMDKLKRLENINISCIKDLPAEARAEKEFFQSQAVQSLIVVPIVYDNHLIGILGFASVNKIKTWSEESVTLLNLVASIVANALQRKQFAQDLRESRNYYRTIFENTGAATLIIEEDMTISMANHEWENIMGYKSEEIEGTKWPRIIVGDIVEKMQDYHRLRRVDPGAVPLRYTTCLKDKQGKVRDGLMIVDIIPRTKKSVATFIDLTDFNRINRALKAISAGNMAVLYAKNEKDLLNNVCQKIVEVGGYSFAWVGYVEKNEEQTIRPVAYAGYETYYQKDMDVLLKKPVREIGPVAIAIQTGQLFICKDIEADPKVPWREEAVKRGYKSMIAIPLSSHRNGPFGVLSIYSEEADIFDEEERRLLTEMAGDLAFGIISLRARIERDQNAQQLETSLEKMHRILNQTVGSLAAVLEIKDPYTAGHQRKVARLATAIAQEMNLDKDTIDGIYVAGNLHDIGKMNIPSEILNKPGKISELEFSLIKTHSQVGYDILKEIEFSWPVADMVLQHHERMDGSGYGMGLSGEELLIGSRILAVADVVDAMASHRPYRPSLGVDIALEEIRKNKGTLYDPEVVDACLRLFAKGFRLE